MPDTIFAIATAPGRAGIAVVRVSGAAAFEAAQALSGPLPRVREARLRVLSDPRSRAVIDRAMVLRFAAPESFTGEDVVEFQAHGSPVVGRAILSALGAIQGLRPAEAGEFTRRALENGRLDLGEVEGLGDLLAAETEAQHRQAVQLMGGALTALAGRWRERLLWALAQLAAELDFADEDVSETFASSICSFLEEVQHQMERELAGVSAAERLREGYEVALVGPPNAGKSTLLNAVARRDVALTSSIAGTTRDVLEVRMDLEGLPVTLLDMAGLHAATDAVEVLGVARARERAQAADLRVFLLDDPTEAEALGVPREAGDVVVLSKGDLRPSPVGTVSGTTGAGIAEVLTRIGRELQTRAVGAGVLGRERHRHAISEARDALERCTGVLAADDPLLDVAAVELQEALHALDCLVGRVDVEAVLDVVFVNFCLGK